MTTTVAETRRADSFGGIARDKNTRRLWVPPTSVYKLSGSGTYAVDVSSDVIRFGTADVAGATERLSIPCPVEFSDMIVKGTTVVDRGIQIVALELIYEVKASALAGFDLDIWKQTYDLEGTPTPVEVTTTLTFDTAGDTGVEIDQHRALALIAATDRIFFDGGTTFHGEIDLATGTSSDFYVYGAIWHLRRVEE